MNERIIYKNPDGSIAILIPAPDSGLTVAQIAAKDVPFGRPYKVVDTDELPQDRAARNSWTVDDAVLTDGVGADYGAGSENDVIGWAGGKPVTRKRQKSAPLEPPQPAKPSVIKMR